MAHTKLKILDDNRTGSQSMFGFPSPPLIIWIILSMALISVVTLTTFKANYHQLNI